MRTSILLSMLILNLNSANSSEIIFAPDKQAEEKKVIKTNASFVHFCLNFLGIASIIKGAGIHVPVVRSCIEIKRVNFYYLGAGILLLTASRMLRHLEKKRTAQKEYASWNRGEPRESETTPSSNACTRSSTNLSAATAYRAPSAEPATTCDA